MYRFLEVVVTIELAREQSGESRLFLPRATGGGCDGFFLLQAKLNKGDQWIAPSSAIDCHS